MFSVSRFGSRWPWFDRASHGQDEFEPGFAVLDLLCRGLAAAVAGVVVHLEQYTGLPDKDCSAPVRQISWRAADRHEVVSPAITSVVSMFTPARTL